VDPPVRVFHAAVRRRAPFYGIAWALVSSWMILIMVRETARDTTFAPIAVLFAIVLTYTTFTLYVQFFRSRIEVSPTGIRYYSTQYVLSAPWSQVKGLAHGKTLFIWPRMELRVARPSIQRNLWFDWGNIVPLSKRDTIPLGPGLWDQEAELLHAIHTYAPSINAAA
jgi:hypothetical protein